VPLDTGSELPLDVVPLGPVVVVSFFAGTDVVPLDTGSELPLVAGIGEPTGSVVLDELELLAGITVVPFTCALLEVTLPAGVGLGLLLTDKVSGHLLLWPLSAEVGPLPLIAGQCHWPIWCSANQFSDCICRGGGIFFQACC